MKTTRAIRDPRIALHPCSNPFTKVQQQPPFTTTSGVLRPAVQAHPSAQVTCLPPRLPAQTYTLSTRPSPPIRASQIGSSPALPSSPTLLMQGPRAPLSPHQSSADADAEGWVRHQAISPRTVDGRHTDSCEGALMRKCVQRSMRYSDLREGEIPIRIFGADEETGQGRVRAATWYGRASEPARDSRTRPEQQTFEAGIGGQRDGGTLSTATALQRIERSGAACGPVEALHLDA